MALAVSAMGINIALQGMPESLGILIPFLIVTVLNLIVAVLLLKNMSARRK